MRFLLLDKVKKLEVGSYITGIKAWSLDNEIFADHFPGLPVVPGVLLTESMAQLLGILIEKSYYHEFGEKEKVFPILSIIQKAKFRQFVSPGMVCDIRAELLSFDKVRATGKATIVIAEEKMADATLSFILLHENQVPENNFMHRREEYLYMILKDVV